eukprot:625535-Pleurochrysis_carterae.AAC.1
MRCRAWRLHVIESRHTSMHNVPSAQSVAMVCTHDLGIPTQAASARVIVSVSRSTHAPERLRSGLPPS